MGLSARSLFQAVSRRLPGLPGSRRRGIRPDAPRPATHRARRRSRGALWVLGLSTALVLYAGPDFLSDVMDRSYVRLLAFPVDSVREAALEKVAERRPESALGHMIRLFTGSGQLAVQSSDALVGFGKVAVAALADAVDDPNPRIRYWAVRTLGKIGRPARPSSGVIASALRDPVAVVRHNALTALPRVDGRIAARAITEFLSFEGTKPIGRILAIQVLESLGREAAGALPALERLNLEDRDGEVRTFAARAARALRGAGGD